MDCEYFGLCGGCSFFENYNLDSKIAFYNKELNFENPQIFSSQLSAFRIRCELGIYHKEDEISFCMRGKNKIVCIDACKIVNDKIKKGMSALKEAFLKIEFREFFYRLFSVEFLGTKDLIITLIYHKNLDESWVIFAQKLQVFLQNRLDCKINLIGRARKTKLILGQDFVIENLNINAQNFIYRYDDSAFVQPNKKMNEKMIAWVLENLEKNSKDLLEMYCGCGNFTLPLSQKFRKVLATEISKTSIKALEFGIVKNEVRNIQAVRLSGDECMEALNKKREFNRLKNIVLDSYDFGCVFVDPPRAGLGIRVSKFLQRFQKIIYISCNPLSLKEDLEILKRSHFVEKSAFFDQFPFTNHLECGVILTKK